MGVALGLESAAYERACSQAVGGPFLYHVEAAQQGAK